MIVCCCDGSVDGILTAVFEAWSVDIRTARIQVPGNNNMEWFADYTDVAVDYDKAGRVVKAVNEKMGEAAFEMVYLAAITDAPDRGDAILQFIRKGMRIGAQITEDLQDRYVMRVFELQRSSKREYEHYRGFLRFRQQGGYLLAKFEPKNDIITLLVQFFSDRLKQERFAIVDMLRAKAAVYEPEAGYYITGIDTQAVGELRYDTDEEDIRELWNTFEKSIAIEARYNRELQQQNMPIRFRKYMDIRY